MQTYLKSGRIVLYSGVSCQIIGLKNFLGKEYDNLYTIEVLCYGVTSPKVWRRYVNEKQKKYGSIVQKINFKSKGIERFFCEIKF